MARFPNHAGFPRFSALLQREVQDNTRNFVLLVIAERSRMHAEQIVPYILKETACNDLYVTNVFQATDTTGGSYPFCQP